MTSPGMALPTRRVDMWFAGATPQNRWTVAFRIILAIPQYIVLYVLFIVTFFVAVIGWFGALFMGRLPQWAHEWISGVIRWSTRVGAYSLLLTDRYPPFALDDQLYPARPMLPPPGGRLNRWAVLFRIVLAVPGFAFATIVQYGLTFPLLIVMWFVALFRGSMPPTLYITYAALLRYEVRLHAWFNMLTSEYPWGMLGDRAVAGPAAAAAPPTPSAPPQPPPGTVPPAEPTAGPTAYGDAAPPAAPPGSPAIPASVPPAYGGAMPPPSAWERSAVPPGEILPPWGTLVLEGAARSWMIFAIVWGAILVVGQNTAQNVVGDDHHRASSSGQVAAHPGDDLLRAATVVTVPTRR